MPAHQLVLLPAEPQTTVASRDELAACLRRIGLLGTPAYCTHGEFFPAGENFLQLLSFLGCSPLIELEPPADSGLLDSAVADGRFCHITLACGEALQFRADPRTRPPHCPRCGQPETAWEAHIRQWAANPAETAWSCPTCACHGELTDLVFRKTAGFGKVFVEIRGIHPSEAVPGTPLLDALRALTGGDWRYIYIKG